MMGWFYKFMKSSRSTAGQQEEEAKDNTNTSHSQSAMMASASKSSSQSVMSSPQRWKRKYDLVVCHSSEEDDNEVALCLVSFLEALPFGPRCFLWGRDSCPGCAIFTEYCQALESSHLVLLLITQNFLQDKWCRYMMHQALAAGPTSKRTIPLIRNLSHSECPKELKFFFHIDMSRNPEQSHNRIMKVLSKFLEDLVKNGQTLECTTHSGSNNSASSSQDSTSEHKVSDDELVSKSDSPEP